MGHFRSVVRRYCPPALVEPILKRVKGIEYVDRGEIEDHGAKWLDHEQVIALDKDKQPPDWIYVHEGLHAWIDSKTPTPLVDEYPILPDVPLFRSWAKATGDKEAMADVDDGELSEQTEEDFVVDAVSWLCGNDFKRVREETPITEEVRRVFEKHWKREQHATG